MKSSPLLEALSLLANIGRVSRTEKKQLSGDGAPKATREQRDQGKHTNDE